MKKILVLLVLFLIPIILIGCHENSSSSVTVENETTDNVVENVDLVLYFGQDIKKIQTVVDTLKQDPFEKNVYSNSDISITVDDKDLITSININHLSPYNIAGLSVKMSVEEANGIMDNICTDIEIIGNEQYETVGTWIKNPKALISYHESQDIPDTIYDISIKLKDNESLS